METDRMSIKEINRRLDAMRAPFRRVAYINDPELRMRDVAAWLGVDMATLRAHIATPEGQRRCTLLFDQWDRGLMTKTRMDGKMTLQRRYLTDAEIAEQARPRPVLRWVGAGGSQMPVIEWVQA